MKTALACDFDNTLYFYKTEERFRAQDIFEILFFQKRGGVFGICTGRSPDSILDITGNFLHPDFIISVSGALIVDGEGKVLDSHCIAPEAAEKICLEFKDKTDMVLHADGHVYALHEVEYPLQIRIHSFEEVPQEAIYGISMRFESEEAAAEAAVQPCAQARAVPATEVAGRSDEVRLEAGRRVRADRAACREAAVRGGAIRAAAGAAAVP